MRQIAELDRGIHSDVSHEEYHQRRVGLVSKHALDLVHRSPAHYKHWVDGAEDEQTPALAFGQAFHCALLEPEVFRKTYIVEPEEPDFGDCRKKDNKAARDAWRAGLAQWREEHQGCRVIDEEDMATIKDMVAAVRRHPLAKKMIRNGVPEATVKWTDPETGLHCKIRADYYVESLSMVADVKSTLDARPEHFKRDVAKYGYHRQDALYRMGFEAIDAHVRHFIFIAVEKEPPHAIAIYALEPEAVSRGHISIRRDIDTLAECVRTNTWPGYSASIQQLELPPWAA